MPNLDALNGHQKTFLSDLLQRLRMTVQAVGTDEPISGADLVDRLAGWAHRWDLTAQDLTDTIEILQTHGAHL